MADTTTKTLRLTIAASTSTAEQAFANLNKEIKNTGVSITGFTTAMTKNAAGMDSYAHYVTLASTSLKELEKTQKSIVGSSAKTPITSNILKDERDIYKERADLAAKSSATMVEKAKAAITAQLIAIREGENSIAAVKNASAERQKQIEISLQEKLKSIRDRYAAGEFNKGSLDLSIRSITEAYQRQTVSLVTETDKRIAKIKEEIAAQQEAARVARLSIAQRLGEAQVYTLRSDAGIALTRGMTQAGLAARPTVPQVQAPVIPPIPQETRSSYDSLFARIGAINIEYRLWNTAINAVSESLRGVPRVGIELDAVRASLSATMGTAAGTEAALKGLEQEATRTGISITTLRENFKNLQASTSLSGVSLRATWKIFTDLNTVSTALHLNADKTQHVFLAITQIFNKSKVQSEELVKQLGNLLPGAFASFATSMGISTEELTKKMKAGTVTARDTMENFVAFLAERFQPAFALASDGVNANIGRMQNQFTLLQEAIYASTSGPINSFVKSMTEALKYVTNLAKGTEELSIWIKGAFYAAMVAVTVEIGSFTIGMIKAAEATKLLGTALTFLYANPIIAGLAAVGAAVAAVGVSAQSSANSINSVLKLRQEIGKELETAGPTITAAKALEIKVDDDPTVKRLRETKDRITAGIQDIRGSTLPLVKQMLDKDVAEALQGKTDTFLIDKKEVINYLQSGLPELTTKITEAENKARESILNKRKEELANMQKDESTKLNDIVEATRVRAERQAKSASEAYDYAYQQELKSNKANLEGINKTIEAYEKGAIDVNKAKTAYEKELLEEKAALRPKESDYKLALEGRKNIEESAREAGERNRQIYLDKEKTSAKSATAERLKGIKEEISQVKEYQRTAANEAENQIKLLDAQNKAKIYSFEEYVRRKKEILTKDYEAEKSFTEQQRALAVGTGRKDLAAKYEERLKQLKDTYESKVGTAETKGVIDNEAQQKIDEYNTNLTMIHQRYQDILGIERDSNDLSSTKLELLRKQLELESKEKGEVGERARIGAKELEILVQAQNLKANIAINQRNLTAAEKVANDALQRNQELKQVGQMTDLQYALSNTKIKREQIRLSELEVDAIKRKLDAAKPEERPAAQATYDIAKQKLESLKLVADETGAMIEQSLGNAFDNAFTGLINKSMTASQAFKSFANSVLGDIAKILAQEMRSQLLGAILKPLAGAALSGLGSLGQSAGLFQATNISSTPGFVGPMKPTFAANGGVFAGAGISAHSGTIVSSPTVFPFAKGIGLMGEAGPEAILPLKRNAQGKLGVVTENAGQSKGNLYNITVNVQSKQGENPEQFGQRAAAAMMRSIAKEEISNAKRPGNTLNKARFG